MPRVGRPTIGESWMPFEGGGGPAAREGCFDDELRIGDLGL